MTFNEYISKLSSYDYIIETTKSLKCKRDYIKARNRLILKYRKEEKNGEITRITKS